MNATSRLAVYLMICCTIFTSLGQILWKFGINKIDFNYYLTIFNLPFILGFVSYGVGWIFLMLAFRKGELSVLYPIIATSYIWVSLISPLLFPTDSMTLVKWIGVTIILFGVTMIGIGGTKKKIKNG
jgi:multidrug transporter EmrE-like cation transporter